MADSVEEAIRTYLTDDTTFAADYDGIYWLEADSATYPYIVYWQLSGTGTEEYVDREHQGEARVQFDVWDNSKFRGVRLRADLREKIETLNETVGGYYLRTQSVTEQTVQREDGQSPFHFVVDAVIYWSK